MKRLVAAIALLGALGLAPAARAQELLGSYTAYIGEADLHNSSGARLWQPWQIVRQDRANFHRFGIRDEMDEWDPFFADIDNRAAMEQMIRNGWIDPEAARKIVEGGVMIYVSVYSYGAQGHMVTVDIYR
jgi:hypothetical protein